MFCKICELNTEHESEPEIGLKILQLISVRLAAKFLEQFQVYFHVQTSELSSQILQNRGIIKQTDVLLWKI